MQGGFRMSEDVDVSYARLVALLEAGLVHTSPQATRGSTPSGRSACSRQDCMITALLHDHAPSA
jgi:hypothetical protein